MVFLSTICYTWRFPLNFDFSKCSLQQLATFSSTGRTSHYYHIPYLRFLKYCYSLGPVISRLFDIFLQCLVILCFSCLNFPWSGCFQYMLILWNFGTSTATLMFVFFSSGIFGPPLSYWLIFQVIDIGRFNFPAHFLYWLGNILKIHGVCINNCGTYNSN